jgi:hypothetical protein
MRASTLALVLSLGGGCATTQAELDAQRAAEAAEAARNEQVGAAFVRGYQARGRPHLEYGGNPYSKPTSSTSGTSSCSSGYVGQTVGDALATAALALLGVCPH